MNFQTKVVFIQLHFTQFYKRNNLCYIINIFKILQNYKMIINF